MDDDAGDVFAIPDLYAPSKLLVDAPENNSFLFSQLKLDDIDSNLPNVVDQEGQDDVFFSIPDLSFGFADGTKTPTHSTTSGRETPQPVNEQDEEVDIWALLQEPAIKAANYQSWDGFEKQKSEQYNTPYITEAGPAIFDTALTANEDYLKVGNTEYLVVDAKIYTKSLLALGLGRSSVFFCWDEEKKSFVPALSNIRISGYTGDTLGGLLSIFMECGNITRSLQSFVDKTYTINASPGRIALADSVSSLLATIQSSLSISAASQNSVLQLQALFQPAHAILICFRRIIVNVSVTRSDEAMLSTIFEEIQLLEHRTDSLREILLEILTRVSQPWLEFASEWLGLQREAGLPLTKEGKGKSFVKVENKDWVDDQGLEMHEPDYILNYDKVPSFILPDDARAMFEVGRSLRFLRDHHPTHPLARADVVASAQPPSLEWNFSWQDVKKVEAKALEYEKNLLAAIQRFSKDTSQPEPHKSVIPGMDMAKLDFFGKPEHDMQAHLLASIDAFDQPLNGNAPVDQLSAGLNKYLFANDGPLVESTSIFAPPIALVPILSFNPIIATQARIVNGICMRLFFNSHKLREHLAVQRNFHLLGNGVFSSRLSHALFDPELESAERHRGVARSGGIMGLRLGGRDTWPPASSELRLALMGVLTESYESKQTFNQSTSHRGTYLDQTSLPGDLSFAVRDMSEDEIEKCMNPDSVEALDFLRLSYKPPPPLEAVITPIILYKYDQLFKLLLRVIRMLYVVSALFRDAKDHTSNWQNISHIAQRFRIEAHHFITSVCGYFFDTGIEATWRVFERKLDQIEAQINSNDNLTLGQNEGLDKLRDYHEKVLDRIMFALLLRKRQQPVMKLLEEIFALILQFSKHSRERALGMERKDGEDEAVKELYLKFRDRKSVV